MKVPAGTQCCSDFKLSGKGVPHMRVVAVVLTYHANSRHPDQTIEKQQEIIRQFKETAYKPIDIIAKLAKIANV
jgi:translation elongation factor EF-Ts